MVYYVYLILSKKVNKYISYVGYTSNLSRRINLHNNSKGAKFTRGRFWKLAYSKRYESMNIALKEEYKLKVNLRLRNEIKKEFSKNENFCSFTL